MDWDSLKRKPQSRNDVKNNVTFQIDTKKVKVSKNDLIRLPDGTTIVKDSSLNK